VILRRYIVDGLSVRDLVLAGEDEKAVLEALAAAGLKVQPDQVRDPVCAAVGWAGYRSFEHYASTCGFKPLSDQAAELGVPVGAVRRLHDILRSIAEQRHEQAE
jgi:hypothetical protein